MTKLSIVCPAYEEEACLPFFHQELSAVLAGLGNEWEVEILYVDDGSRDRTLEVLKALAATDRRVRYLSLSRNFGKEAALTAGLEHAHGDLVITMDSDLQHPPALIPKLLERWREGFDIVLTIREEDRRLGLVKRLTSKMFYRLMRLVSDTSIRPAGCDYRLMTRKVVDSLLQLREHHRFLRGMVRWLGFATAEVRFHPDERKAGETKYSLRLLMSLASDGLFSFSRMPLQISYYLGGAAILIGLLASAGLLGYWLFSGASAFPGWALVFAALHFLGGCILWSVALLGEYVGRIYEQVKQRPLYILKDQATEPMEAQQAPARDAA